MLILKVITMVLPYVCLFLKTGQNAEFTDELSIPVI